MTPNEIAGRYRDYAGKCLAVAQRQESASERLALIDMARAWIALADQAEKNQSRYATPTTELG